MASSSPPTSHARCVCPRSPGRGTTISITCSAYEQTRDAFHIPHDLRILKEVFGCNDGAYARANAYWESHDIVRMIAALPDLEKESLEARVEELTREYGELSELYQASKPDNEIPLA